MRFKKSFILIIIVVAGLFAYIGYQYYLAYLSPTIEIPVSNNINVSPARLHPDWKLFTDPSNAYTYEYPATMGANVWRAVQWPPMVTVSSTVADAVTKGCPNYSAAESLAPAGTTGAAGPNPYTLYRSAGVGAGNLYDEFCFVYPKGVKFYTMLIEINSHTACGTSCGAYCGTPYEQECATLDRKAAIEDPVMSVGQSFRFMQ